MALRSKHVLATFVLLSFAVGVYQAALFATGHQQGLQLQTAWQVVSLMLVVFWVELDCREHKEIYRPFEFGFLLLIFWVFYLPYYLFKTRGVYAVLWLLGLVGLGYLGYALSWLIYVAR